MFLAAAKVAPSIKAFVVLPKAETTTANFWSFACLATIANTFFMFSEFATDEPPNFSTFILDEK